jgi:hypothetical protein
MSSFDLELARLQSTVIVSPSVIFTTWDGFSPAANERRLGRIEVGAPNFRHFRMAHAGLRSGTPSSPLFEDLARHPGTHHEPS